MFDIIHNDSNTISIFFELNKTSLINFKLFGYAFIIKFPAFSFSQAKIFPIILIVFILILSSANEPNFKIVCIYSPVAIASINISSQSSEMLHIA